MINPIYKVRKLRLTAVIVISIALMTLSACGDIRQLFSTESDQQGQLAEVLFNAEVVPIIAEDSKVMLEVLDDVTGLYFNSSRFEMTMDEAGNYSVRIPLPVSSEVKYRYVRVATGTAYEFTTRQEQVRFRIARINGPEIIEDIISAWVKKR